jgi:hypothetical protein
MQNAMAIALYEILSFCSSMDGAGGYNAGSNKLGIERQIPHILTDMWKLKKKLRVE